VVRSFLVGRFCPSVAESRPKVRGLDRFGIWISFLTSFPSSPGSIFGCCVVSVSIVTFILALWCCSQLLSVLKKVAIFLSCLGVGVFTAFLVRGIAVAAW
jgi:hypothetical protein